MPIHLPDLPLTHAGWVFALLFAVMLVVPMVAERLRVPAIVGLILAGTLIGPNVLGLIERAGAVELLGSAGLLYLMFLAGVELDLEEFKAHRKDSLVFGVATFAVPMAISVVAVLALGYSLIAAVLIASCWASHTLLAYPLFRRFGTQSSRAVATSVGATIITDTAALLVLVVVVAVNGGDVGPSFWLTLMVSLSVLLALLLVGLPALARWFFTGIGQDRGVRFGFVLLALFASAGLAELAGVEAIIGAFLAGLSLNRLVPAGSLLMERLEFLGGQLLIPLFLISVGMLVDPAVLSDPKTLGIAVAFIAMALVAKFLAAVLAGKVLGYDRTEIGAMFALSGAQAAATLAAIIVGFDVGLIDADTVNAVVLVILATCLTTSWVAGAVAPRLPRPDRRQRIGDVVVVPVARPESRLPLLSLAAIMAVRDSGTVIPLSVLGPEADRVAVKDLQAQNAESEQIALAAGAEAHGIVRIDATPSAGILHTVVEHRGSLLVLGWKGWTSAREALFGGIVDQVITEAPVPLLLGRLGNAQPRGVLLIVSSANTSPAGMAGLQLALAAAARIAKHHQIPVRVLAGSEDRVIRDEVLRVLGAEATILVDERRPSIAARERVVDGELVVVPVKPDKSGLHGVAARLARALPDHDLLVALDARSLGTEPGPGAVDAVSRPAKAPAEV